MTRARSRLRNTWRVFGPSLVAVGCTGAAPAELGPVEQVSSAISAENLSGSNLAATNLAGSNLAGANLGGANLGGTNLAGTNLAGTNLAGTNLAGSNLAGTNLAGTNLAGTNLAGSNLAGTNLAGTNLAGTNLAGSNLAGTNLAGNNLGGTSLGSTNLAGRDSGANIHGLSGAVNGLLYSGEDLWKPTGAPTNGTNSGQCVVMGIGSTAFPKLLGQQSSNAKISVALGKLPWGFASSLGGAANLDAWEALVWGDRTYCTFVMVSPVGTSWAGVAGFIKAIFRWNAPPSQSMDISGIDASAPYDSTLQTYVYNYTGMMDAAAKWRAGKILDKNFIAGEVAFATATTNNMAVQVDFSSWVLDQNMNGLILGNVQTSPLPSYVESVYLALDNGDGTVSVKIDAARPTWMSGNLSSNLPPGMTDSYLDLWNAYKKSTSTTRPTARRCGGALYLHFKFRESVPVGKCDNGLTWYEQICIQGYQTWSKIPGTTAPMNSYMVTTLPGGQYMRSDNSKCNTLKRVLSETYIHLWQPNYIKPGTCTPSTCAAQGKTCGSVSDGCGGTLNCGGCSSPQTCGGSGTANVCG